MAAPPPPAAANTHSWRNPSVKNQTKHNAIALPESFEPTEEEQALLSMYDAVKSYERQAARLKEQKAREKLATREAEFKETERKKKEKRRAQKAAAAREGAQKGSDQSSDDEDVDDDDSADGSEREQKIRQSRAEKLEVLRDEVDAAKQSIEEEEKQEEELRDQYLASNENDDLGPMLKRKRLTEPEEGKKTLLTSMMKKSTPPHEFSEKLGLKPWKGKILFPTSLDETRWVPPSAPSEPNDGALVLELENFDISQAQNGLGNNTIAIKFNAPIDSKRFSINIAGPDHGDFNSVLFHFNPRQHERGGQLVVNDKQETIWGQAIALPLSQVPLMFGQTSVTLIIQINGDGFDIFVENKHCARLEHRTELPSKPCTLFLQFPSCDDSCRPENWTMYRTWWGNKPHMAKGDISSVAGVNSYNAVHPRKLFISGLDRIHSEADVDRRRAELERAFRKYGGDLGVKCIIPTNVTYAFVEMESDRQADLALVEMAGKYRLNRARRSRHEALQEKRAAAEAAKKSNVVKESSEW